MMKRILCTIVGAASLFLGIAGSAQQEITKGSNGRIKDNQLSADASSSPLDLMRGKKEDLTKRDAYSKHFLNEDGSYTAVIGAGPIHYEKNGQFLDIDHTIIAQPSTAYPYANTTNMMESYFGATSHTGIKSVTAEGEVREFLNNKMYWEVNGQAVNTVLGANVPVSLTQNDKALYDNLFGQIGAEFTIESGKRKLNYIIPSAAALGNVPANAQYLTFSEDVELPMGWTYTTTNGAIVVYDANGTRAFQYDAPVSTDASGELKLEANTTFETVLNGNVLSIRTRVNTAWLLSSERQYPVMVDPTSSASSIAYTPIYDDGEVEGSGHYFGRVSGYWLRAINTYDASSIPSGSTVSAVVSNFNIAQNIGTYNSANAVRMRNAGNPSVLSGTTLYNASNTNLSNNLAISSLGDKTITLNTAGNTYVQSSLGGNIYMAIDPAGSYNATGYYRIGGTPSLSITYTVANVPPSCATAVGPANGATGIGQQGGLAWNPVGGATSYDVYFGTSSSPALVASNVVGTQHVINECLLPGTTYYWQVIPKNANGSATGCAVWSFTTDNKLVIYKNDFETATVGIFPTSGSGVDGWLVNNSNSLDGYNNAWTLGTGVNAISGKSVGVSRLYNNGLQGDYFQYWSDLGEIHRWIYRPFDMSGLRDIEVNFRWKCGGEANQDYGSVISSINNGANFIMHPEGGLNNNGMYHGSATTIRSQSVTLESSRNNQAGFVLGFKWDDWSGNGIFGYPSFVVDDIIIKACPYEGNITSPVVGAGQYTWTPIGSTQAVLTVAGSHSCAQYQWEQSTNGGSTWVNAVGGSGATTASYTTPNNISNSTWYRCKVYFGTGCAGVYQAEAFKILTTVSCVAAVAPADDATDVALNQALSWSADPLATSYDVYFGTTANAPFVSNVTGTSYSATLQPGTTYFWKIIAKDAAGEATGCEEWSFTTGYATAQFHNYGGSAQLAFNNSRSASSTPIFRLSHNAGTATAYQVEINTAAAFNGTSWTQVFSGSYAANTQNNFTFNNTNGVLTNGTTYYVRARVNGGSGYGAWTTGTYSFTYDTAKEEADWFQTTQAQFQTGVLDGVEANAANNVVKLSGNNNAIVNGTFANTSGWTTFKTNGTPALIEVSSTDCSNCPTGTNRNLKMYLWTAGVLSGDIMIVSQQVDLTNVNEITYNANSYYGPNSSNPGGTISNLRFMIGGASNNEVGDVLHTTNQAYCTSYCTNSVDDPNVVINTSGYTGVHTIKFVVKFTQTHTTAGLLAFYVNNVSATMASNASITSPTIYKASKLNASNWETLSWNQTLNGGNITLALQEVVGGTWTAISGFDNITAGGNGLQTMDVSTLTSDSLRMVATLSGTTSPALHDWAISAGGCVAPAVIGELEATIIGCYYNITSLSLSGEGTAPLAYQWQVSTNGGATWNNLSNDFYYGGVKTTQLNIANVPNAFNGNKYRLRITNACGTAYSNETLMNVQECPPNDNPSNSNPNLSNNTYVYPNNVQVSGSTTNATVNPATGTRDVWYRIIPISNGVTIKVSSTVIDPVLYLFDSNDMITPIDVENLIAGTGTEIMNVTGLTEGHVYRLAVASASELDGEFKLVVQHLRKPQCSVNTNISLCEMLSTSITGANSVTYEFTDVNSNVTTSYTAPGYNMLASTAAAQLRYGATYNAQYTANYHLQNGLGEAETILVPNTQTCNINIGSHREVVVKVNNRCTSGAVHARSGYLTGEFVGAGGVCTITGYEYEYTPVANCAGDDPQPLDKFSKVIISASAYMSLNYAFNHMPLANNPNRGYWSVRIRPRFNGYSGVYGQPFVIAVNGTAPVVGMAAEPNFEPVKGVNTLGGNIDANIYPNPNNGELVNLNITGITSNEVYVRVMDSMGREVYTNRYSVDGTLNTMVSFTRPLAQGVYMVEMRAGEEVKTQRMVVTK